MLLIWLFTSPAHQAWLWRDTPLTWIDGVAATLFVALFIGEAIADEQMWAFQQDKKRKLAASEEIKRPFITTGLFRYCRHPNYLYIPKALWLHSDRLVALLILIIRREWGGTPAEREATRGWLRSKANSIDGGTSEIQRNIIAKRVPGLPD